MTNKQVMEMMIGMWVFGALTAVAVCYLIRGL